MGWAHCGTDSKGRNIGYAISATCDHAGCKKRIDRGLGYACGGEHGEGETCEGYFCGDHLVHGYVPSQERHVQVCTSCAANLTEAKSEDFARNLLEVVEDLKDVDRADPVAMAAAIDEALKSAYQGLIQWDEGDDLPIDARYMEPHEVTKYEQVAENRAYWRQVAEDRTAAEVGA